MNVMIGGGGVINGIIRPCVVRYRRTTSRGREEGGSILSRATLLYSRRRFVFLTESSKVDGNGECLN